MLSIPGVTQDKLDRYGTLFLKLVRNVQRSYEDMMQHYEDRPQDPNHQNVIDLISDDEAGDDDDEFDDDDLDVEDESQEEISKFFRPSIEVDTFNATLQGLAPAAPTSRAESANNDMKNRGASRGGKSTFRDPGGGYSKGRRKASAGSNKGKAPAGVSKSKSTSNRSSGSSFGPSPNKRGVGGVGFAHGGIGMMPT